MSDAVHDAARYYNYRGIIEPSMAHLIQEEGFVPGSYKDHKGIETEGVGMVGENAGLNFFTEVYPKYMAKAKKKVKVFDKMDEAGQNAVLSAVYRGDLGPKATKLLNQGRWEDAAKEYLNHKEYRELKRSDPQHGVVQRMERNAAAIRSQGDQNG